MKGLFNLLGAMICYLATICLTIIAIAIGTQYLQRYELNHCNGLQLAVGLTMALFSILLASYTLGWGQELWHKRFN